MNSRGTSHRLLLVDDDKPFLERLIRLFKDDFEQVESAASVETALEAAVALKPTHAVLDLRVGLEAGVDLIEPLVSLYATRIVMLTGYGSIASTLEAVRRGAINYLTKPVTLNELRNALFGGALVPVSRSAQDHYPSLDQLEWEHIQRVLFDCKGNVTHAARRLGIHRQALQRKLRNSR